MIFVVALADAVLTPNIKPGATAPDPFARFLVKDPPTGGCQLVVKDYLSPNQKTALPFQL